jgi:hypothetical protein
MVWKCIALSEPGPYGCGIERRRTSCTSGLWSFQMAHARAALMHGGLPVLALTI